ncbi:hypothetical protein P12x_004618 [Tundrisphaera lichenicola]|uniref:hypothetical protein n=1 Tax=Tundrisphaera lichenicola TaxID=2029860 RepID=UPI003EBE80BA
MKLPRLSIGMIMAGVILLAADFMIVRSILSRLAVSLNLYVFGILPMANILVVVAFLIGGTGKKNPFWLGFSMTGLASVLTSYWWLDPYCDALETAILSSGLGTRFHAIPTMIAELIVLPGIFLIPQLLVAMAGGWLARLLPGRSLVSTSSVPRSRRVAMVSILLFVVVTPAIGIEGYFQSRVDPLHGRFAPGTEAVIQGETHPPFEETLNDGTKFAVPERTRVKVVLDGFPSQFAAFQNPANNEYQHLGDVRMVQVTLLDGERAGQSVYVCRYRLRPD